jgi:hypothetical protein
MSKAAADSLEHIASMAGDFLPFIMICSPLRSSEQEVSYLPDDA